MDCLANNDSEPFSQRKCQMSLALRTSLVTLFTYAFTFTVRSISIPHKQAAVKPGSNVQLHSAALLINTDLLFIHTLKWSIHVEMIFLRLSVNCLLLLLVCKAQARVVNSLKFIERSFNQLELFYFNLFLFFLPLASFCLLACLLAAVYEAVTGVLHLIYVESIEYPRSMCFHSFTVNWTMKCNWNGKKLTHSWN